MRKWFRWFHAVCYIDEYTYTKLKEFPNLVDEDKFQQEVKTDVQLCIWYEPHHLQELLFLAGLFCWQLQMFHCVSHLKLSPKPLKNKFGRKIRVWSLHHILFLCLHQFFAYIYFAYEIYWSLKMIHSIFCRLINFYEPFIWLSFTTKLGYNYWSEYPIEKFNSSSFKSF